MQYNFLWHRHFKSIKRKNKLYRCYLCNPTPENELYYKRYKNKLNHSIRIAKSSYYARKLQDMKYDMKSTWKVLNEVINKKITSKSTISPLFKTSDNMEISDPILIANKFYNYFTNVGPNLAKKIKPTCWSHREFLLGCYTQSVFFDSVTSAEIVFCRIAKSFQSNKAAGYDKIPMSAIKQSINIIAEPLSHILNLSIATENCMCYSHI